MNKRPNGAVGIAGSAGIETTRQSPYTFVVPSMRRLVNRFNSLSFGNMQSSQFRHSWLVGRLLKSHPDAPANPRIANLHLKNCDVKDDSDAAAGLRLGVNAPSLPHQESSAPVPLLALFFGPALRMALACLALSGLAMAQDSTNAAVDADGNGLIEIDSLEKLNNVRHNLRGTSYKFSEDAEENAAGCPASVCRGYELMANLDFDADGNGPDADDPYWNDGNGWEPIGTGGSPFAAAFEGNGYTISNLFINRPAGQGVGLFGVSEGQIKRLGLIDADVTGNTDVGSLAGELAGSVAASYAVATVSGNAAVGGLAGRSEGNILASYATATVSGNTEVGGLVGRQSDGDIRASYALATASGNAAVGGLVGNPVGGGVAASYFAADIAGLTAASQGRTTDELQMPTSYGATIYAAWNVDVTGDSTADDPWHFGTAMQYPGLALPQAAEGSCPAAANNISIAEIGAGAAARCIHRPFLLISGFSLADDERQSTHTRITHDDNPLLTGKTVPGYQVRIVSITTGAEATTVTDVNGKFLERLPMREGVNQLEVYARPPGGEYADSRFNALEIVFVPIVDIDGNGLIEIDSLEKLNNIRHNLRGTSYKFSEDAEENALGCPAGVCRGYELVANLDFDTDGNGRTDVEGDDYWNDGEGWNPIGNLRSPLTRTLEGNNHTIANLFINRPDTEHVGLVGANVGQIRHLGLVNANVTGHSYVGSLVGVNSGPISASYAIATTVAAVHISAGGLVGNNEGRGSIRRSYAVATVSVTAPAGRLAGGLVGSDAYSEGLLASYAVATVSGNTQIGGLVGQSLGGVISASYAVATVSGNAEVGGLAGLLFLGDIKASYALATVSGRARVGGLVGHSASGVIASSYFSSGIAGLTHALQGRTADELQMPTSYGTDAEIYAAWNVDVSGDNVADDPWHFGTATQYPGLALPQAADGSCPAVATSSISVAKIGTAAARCVHRPFLLISGFGLADDEGQPIQTRIVRNNNPMLAGKTLPGYQVRIVFITAGTEVAVTADANGKFFERVALARGVNRFKVYARPPGGEYADSRFNTLEIIFAPLADADGDGLIEIDSLEKLNNIRHNLRGTSYKSPEDAEGNTLGCPKDICHGYELTDDLNFDTDGDGRTDIEGDDYWNGGAGWEPIGTGGSPFAAAFEGNNRTISNLFIDRGSEDYIGLFGSIDSSGEIRNLGVVDADVTGNSVVGGVVGNSAGAITASYAVATVSGNILVGGAVGLTLESVTASYAVATVSGTNQVGGLVGGALAKDIISSYAVATVSGDILVGGLVGLSEGNITASYAVATVSGNSRVGGLVGLSEGDTIASYAVATVSGTENVGGLEGLNSRGDIIASYAAATVSGTENVGGLAGLNSQGDIVASYAATTVSGTENVGGLAGRQSDGDIRASYALATVSGTENVGGLTGQNFQGDIVASYALATVSGNTEVGGLVGHHGGGAVTASYFDAEIAGLTHAAQGKTTDELQAPTSYGTDTAVYAAWNVDVTGDSTADDPWHFGTARQYPGLALPQAAEGGCPASTSNISMAEMGTGVAARCIHRPFLLISGFSLADDEGQSTRIRITPDDNPLFTGKTLPGYQVRIVSITTGAEAATIADANGKFLERLTMREGVNRLEVYARPPGGEYVGSRFNTLEIAYIPIVDADGNGLIEIDSLEKLNNIRHNLAGTSYKYSEDAEANATGCPASVCRGYELTAHLDFDTDGNGRTDIEGDDYWNDGAGWNPIGTGELFAATFDGNGYTIANLFIDRPENEDVALISYNVGQIKNVGLVKANVRGGASVGSLVGWNRGVVAESYAMAATISAASVAGGLVGRLSGSVTASYAEAKILITIPPEYHLDPPGHWIGGLVGESYGGDIIASYAVATVSGSYDIGGLVGRQVNGSINASYALATASGNSYVGGLVGNLIGETSIAASYFAADIAGLASVTQGKTTDELRAPTSYGTDTAIYADWNVDVSGDGVADNPWRFGAATQYPGLALPQPAEGGCPAATSNIDVEELGAGAAARCAHRPFLLISGFSLADDEGQSTQTRVTSIDNPTLTGRTLPGYQVRIASVTSSTEVTAIADANGRFLAEFTLAEGISQLEVYVRPPGGGYTGDLFNTLRVIFGPVVDVDSDGLIEVDSLEKLNNIRHNLAGTSYKFSKDAVENTMGCPENVCRGYELMANLDFDADGNGPDADDPYWNDGSGWEPLGMSGFPFVAIFEGNNHAISNLFIDRGSENYVGLFGITDMSLFGKTKGGGEIRNLGVVNADVTGNEYVGSLVGLSHGDITASYALATTVVASRIVGGLVGQLSGSIAASYAMVTVLGNNWVGGLVGHNWEGNITDSYVVATVLADERKPVLTALENDKVGGMVGMHERGDITASYAVVTVLGIDSVGGLAGFSNGDIAASYAVATVSGNDRVGGLVGYNERGDIVASYAVATVSGNTEIGGLVGYNRSLSRRNVIDITASYAVATVSGNDRVGGLVGYNPHGGVAASYFAADIAGLTDALRGRTTDELQTPTSYGAGTAIYADWNVDVSGDGVADDPWHFGTARQYPGLALPRPSRSGCSVAAGNISIAEIGTGAAARCIHRPFLLISELGLADDEGRLIYTRITHDDNPLLTGKTVPGYQVRIVSITTGAEATTVTDANGKFLERLPMLEGVNQLEVYARPAGGSYAGDLFNTLEIIFAPTVDVDGDGLIEIDSLEKLNNVRHNLRGTSYKFSEDAEENAAGCPASVCRGYELMANLDFDADGNGPDADDPYWNDGSGWEPIGTGGSPFAAAFEGNGYTISNLFINRPAGQGVGLFGVSEGQIKRLGLIDADVTGNTDVGSLAGELAGSVAASYAIATVSGNAAVGGLAGRSEGNILASYAAATVSGNTEVGGLVGRQISGNIRASYALATASGNAAVGGLVGNPVGGGVAASYFAADIAGLTAASQGRTVDELQTPTNYGTAIYAAWNVDVTGDSAADDPWHFGTAMQYPGLALPQAAEGSCPAAANNISIAEIGAGAAARYIHRPFLLISGFSLADDERQSTHTRITHDDNPLLTGKTVPGYQVRIVSITTGAEATTVTDANGKFLERLPMLEGVNQLEVYARPPGGSYAGDLFNTLEIIFAPTVDVDGNGLIEIDSLEKLNNIRHNLSGTSYKFSEDAEENAAGCPASVCRGYELMANLDFDADGNGPDADDPYWNDGSGWEPIGTGDSPFAAAFEGNGHTIANLFINRPAGQGVGLFGVSEGQIKRLGLIDADVTGNTDVGSLAGELSGSVAASYAIATVSGNAAVGGLAGRSEGNILASYAAATVSGNTGVGGLVGRQSDGDIRASYALATASGNAAVGGLVGNSVGGGVAASYFAADIAGLTAASQGRTVDELQTPTNYGTAIYAAWNVDVTGDSTADDPWHFGTAMQYPGLALPQAAEGSCPVAADNISIAEIGAGVAARCIHRPFLLISGFSLADDEGQSTHTRITHDGNPMLTGKTLPGYQVRIVSITTGAEATTIADSNGKFWGGVVLLEGVNQFEVYAKPAGGSYAGDLFSTLEIIFAPAVDVDGNGLIEIDSLGKLNNIRHNLRGTSYKFSEDAKENAVGCPASVCRGYELMANLDFDADGNGPDADDPHWNDGSGWEPIGTDGSPFTATFEGNNHTIANLFIDRPDTEHVGLVGANVGQIRHLGLVNANVTGHSYVGSLVGVNRGPISASYAIATTVSAVHISAGGLVGNNEGRGSIRRSYAVATVSVTAPAGRVAGGLAGLSDGDIIASYALATVSGFGSIGGLVGALDGGSGDITASYAVAQVSGNTGVGGLAGRLSLGNIKASYALATVSGKTGVGGLVGNLKSGAIVASYFAADIAGLTAASQGRTADELQMPTSYGTDAEIYAAWNVDVTGDSAADDPWHFGTATQYPGLALPQAADGSCPAAATSSISVAKIGTAAAARCIHRPFLLISGFGLTDDEGQPIQTRIVRNNNPMLAGKTLPGHQVRIVSITTGAEVAATADANGKFLKEVVLARGVNRFEVYARPPGGSYAGDLFNTLEIVFVPTVDIDGNGLIEIDSLEKLNNIRHNLSGTSYKFSEDAEGNAVGCPAGVCRGYELMANLDFDAAGNGPDADDPYWNDGGGWEPIGTGGSPFAAAFEGNGYTIANLFINRPADQGVGLFGVSEGQIKRLGLVNADVTGSADVGSLAGELAGSVATSYAIATTVSAVANSAGGLAGSSGGDITSSYASAIVSGIDGVGGLVGTSEGNITTSYAVSAVSGTSQVGGLVGFSEGDIIASYAVVAASGTANVGGLVGLQQVGNIRASYALATVSGNTGVGGLVGKLESGAIAASYFAADLAGLTFASQGRTTNELQTPTSYGAGAAIYAAWNIDVDGDSVADNPWHFGTATQYPGLALPRQAGIGCSDDLNRLGSAQRVGERCIHRPVAFAFGFGLDLVTVARISKKNNITNDANSILVGKTLPNNHVRIISATGKFDATADANGDFRRTVALNEGINRFEIFVRKSSGDDYFGPLGSLEIVLDSQVDAAAYLKPNTNASTGDSTDDATIILDGMALNRNVLSTFAEADEHVPANVEAYADLDTIYLTTKRFPIQYRSDNANTSGEALYETISLFNADASIECYSDEVVAMDASSVEFAAVPSCDLTDLPDGAYSMRVSVVDAVGNAGEVFETNKVLLLDSTLPALSLSKNADGKTQVDVTEINLYALEYGLSNGACTEDFRPSWRHNGASLLTPSADDYCFVATDRAGNRAVASSADAMPTVLRLKLRVFLEGALP